MDASNKLYKYIYNQNLMFSKSSVHCENPFRLKIAKDQLELEAESVDTIIKLVKEFLEELGMGIAKGYNPKIDCVDKVKDDKMVDLDYKRIRKKCEVKGKSDIVWMKFADSGHLGCVAVGADINFKIPPDEKHFNDRKENEKWEYNTSGIIIKTLGKKWDESFVLVFPLSGIPKGLKHGDIECGIGNYLIDKGVPILDYYSHRF